MESKKPFSSMTDDLQPLADSNSTAARPPSPFRTSRLSGRRSSAQRAESLTQLIEPSQPISCVTRETFEEDCARHRFIVWAAVKRNSCSRMTAEERLECPLLRCTQRFVDHEAMLRHLAGCEFLSLGEYWCYDHMRVERFDDVKCRRCLGHPSKRRKMLSMAKTFFQSLGHKSKKAPTNGLNLETRDSVLPPPPSYESLDVGPLPANLTELSATEIVEIDSTEITATTTTAGPNCNGGAIDPQALLVPELDSMAPSPDSSMQWQPVGGVVGPAWPVAMPVTPPEESELPSPGCQRPLQVNAQGPRGGLMASRPATRLPPTVPRSKILSPSSSVRSNASTNSNVSTVSNVSSLPSHWSGAWSMASDFSADLTSPIDLSNPEGFLSNNPFAGSCDASDAAFPELSDGLCSELPADVPASKHSQPLSPDPMLFSLASDFATVPTYAANVELMGDSADLLELGDAELEDSNICCSESKSLVGSAWDALQEHIVSSMLKTQGTSGNHLADQLRSKSTKSIATAGLRTFRSLLDGNRSIPAIDIVCFIHLIYAFSLAIHEQDAARRARDLFLQSLSYATLLPPGERELYMQLTREIWQPTDVTSEHIRSHFSRGQGDGCSRSLSIKGKGPEAAPCQPGAIGADSLLIVACNFLDELESSITLGETPASLIVQTSGLYAKHLLGGNLQVGVNLPFSTTISLVLSRLVQDFGDVESLVPKLSGLHQRVNNGVVASVRRVELELLSAGKNGCMSSSRFFDDYVPAVRKLCDEIYRQHDSGTSRRSDYHRLGISLIESLIPELDLSKRETNVPNEEIVMKEFLDEITATYEAGPTESYAPIESITGTPFDIVDPSTLDGTSTTGLQISASTTATTQARASQSDMGSAAKGPSSRTQSEHGRQQQQGPQKVEADSCCEICGYRPKGDPQWFKGSMAKHKKLQHSSAPPKVYKCPYADCTSQYKNRPDNLRQHQIEKGHFVGEEANTAPRRPSKRKKTE